MLLSHLHKISYKFTVRVRYAPSPTGPMHLGAVRTALFNYMFAQHNNGKFILRIQDTDLERNVKGAEEEIVQTLEWLGIRPHQSMKSSGAYGPYIQSQRLNLYKQIQNDLLRKNLAYPCFCQTTNTTKKTKSKQQQPQNEGYDGKCRKLTIQQVKTKIANGQKYSIRIKSNIPQYKSPTFKDQLHGTITATPFDDYVLVKKNGYPTYHFANVVDDWKMDITHVIRGMEWLTNTPKHVYLYKVLGVKPPLFVHLPLIFTNDGKKLSKRDPTAPIANLKEKGYQPEAIINYTGLMGYNPRPAKPQQQVKQSPQSPVKQKQPQQAQKNQYFSLAQLCQLFQLQKVKTSPVKSDQKKLNFFNRYYLRKKWKEQNKQLAEQIYGVFRNTFNLKSGQKQYSEQFLKEVVECTIERVNNLEDFKQYGYFFKRPNLQSEASFKDIKKIFGENVTWEQSSEKPKLTKAEPIALQKSKKVIHNLRLIFTHIIGSDQYTQTKIAQTISQFLYDNKDIGNEDAYHILRLAVTGQKSGVNIVKTCALLGRQRVQQDLKTLYEMIQ